MVEGRFLLFLFSYSPARKRGGECKSGETLEEGGQKQEEEERRRAAAAAAAAKRAEGLMSFLSVQALA
jgi:hypothetical protein